mmetsp:Transcript_92957/g.201026  ORF Transcript_92957/g.201026 Transcript_92957/m.201026 type:complete len:102 (+) Transcript_92957:1107-1412(+)
MGMMNEGLTAQELDDFFDMLDVNGDGQLNYDEFISSVWDTKKAFDSVNMNYLFHKIDKDGSNTIILEELKDFINDNDVSFIEADIKQILTELDKNKDGTVS